jgi:hypothetical protein
MNTLCNLLKTKFAFNSNQKLILLQYVVNEYREIPKFVQYHIQSVDFELEYNPFYFHLITFQVVG